MIIGLGLGLGLAGRSAGGAAAFDPATLNLTGWLRADYAGSPWSHTASAGTSGSNGAAAEATNAPATGSAVNGYTPADFNGSSHFLVTSDDWSVYANATALTVIVLFNADTASAAAGSAADDHALISDRDRFNLGFTDGGISAAYWDGSDFNTPTRIACATGAWHAAVCRLDGGTFGIGLDGPPTQTASGGSHLFTGGAKMAVGIGGLSTLTKRFDGKILEALTSDTAFSDANIDNVISYFNSRYGLSL